MTGIAKESYWRSRMLSAHLDHMAAQGYEVEEATRARANMPQQETLIKLFALACKTGREARAVEVAELMSGQQAVQLVIKYASRLRKMQLAERLTDIARAKAQDEAGEQDEPEEEEEEYQPSIIKRSVQLKQQSRRDEEAAEEKESIDEVDEDGSQDLYDDVEESVEEEKKAPLLKFGQKSEKPLKSLAASQGRPNPFKVQSQSSVSTQGSSVFDKMSPQRKKKRLPEPAKQRTVLEAAKPAQKKASAQVTLLGKKVIEKSQENEDTKSGQTAFQLWMSANETDLQEEHPDIDAAELVLIAARAFKQLSPEQKKEWQQKAKGTTENKNVVTSQDDGATIVEKRKRDAEDSDPSVKPKKLKDTSMPSVVDKKRPFANTTNAKPISSNTNAKLAAFSFGK